MGQGRDPQKGRLRRKQTSLSIVVGGELIILVNCAMELYPLFLAHPAA